MTKMVDSWTDEELCQEFWASMDEFYGRWKESSGGSLPDFEAAILRCKKNGLKPHPAFSGNLHNVEEKTPGGIVHTSNISGRGPTKGSIHTSNIPK